MGLPKVIFNIIKNGLNLPVANVQVIAGIILTGASVANKVQVNTSYQIFSLDDAEQLGILSTGVNAFAHKQIADFYNGRVGIELWFMLVASGVTMTEMVDVNNNYATKLLADAKGKIRLLGVVREASEDEDIADGLSEDVKLAAPKVKTLTAAQEALFQPVHVVLAGNSFTGVVADLEDYSTKDYSNLMIHIANNDGSKTAGIGRLLGRKATIPVQRKISRVKDGPVEELEAYLTSGEPVETYLNAWEAIDAKNYTFLRSFANKSGYFYSSDKTCTAATDDFNSLARGMVVYKAKLIAYSRLVDELSDEVPVTDQGSIETAIIKSWQQGVEADLKALMTDQSEISGARAIIDPNQNILQTNRVNMKLGILPVGYSDEIEVDLALTTTLE